MVGGFSFVPCNGSCNFVEYELFLIPTQDTHVMLVGGRNNIISMMDCVYYYY